MRWGILLVVLLGCSSVDETYDQQIDALHTRYTPEHMKLVKLTRLPVCDNVRYKGADKRFSAAVRCIRSYDKEGLEHVDERAFDALLAARRTVREQHYGNGVPEQVIAAARLAVDDVVRVVKDVKPMEPE